jgi:hypothetical protein
MALTTREKNRKYYAKLKADRERYRRIRARHNLVRSKAYREAKSSDSPK